MNALNIMWLLNEVDCNTDILITIHKNKHTNSISINTYDFDLSVFEYGNCILRYRNCNSSEKDVEYWNMVKDWVKNYYQENF